MMFVAEVDDAGERARRRHPDDGPRQRLAHRDDVRVPMEHSKIECEQDENKDEENNPHEHHGPPGTRGSLAGCADVLCPTGSERSVLTTGPPACAGRYSLPRKA